MRADRRSLVWVLLVGAVLLVLVSAAAGVAYLVLSQRQNRMAQWPDPIAAIEPDQIAPELALYPLAGASEVETIDTAISSRDLETAYAALVFSTDLSDVQRIGRLILLGQQFAADARDDRAGLVYQQVYDVAVLSPELSDPGRADALLAVGAGWAQLEERAKAIDAYDQVYLVATRSPYLQMAHRRDLLTVLEAAYRGLGDEDRAQSSRDRIIELDQQTSPQTPAQPVRSPNLQIGTEIISSPELGVLEEARRQDTFALMEGIPDSGTPPSESVARLAEALKAEDEEKLAFYQKELDAATQLGRRLDLRWQLIRWLTLKYRVAQRGFGLSVVPEWEAAAPEIQSTLAKAYEDLLFDYDDLVTGLPEASMVAPGSYEGRRQGILAGRLGLYPNYPAQPLATKLKDAVAEMIAAGYVAPLYVDVADESGALRFFLSPADDYGRAVNAP